MQEEIRLFDTDYNPLNAVPKNPKLTPMHQEIDDTQILRVLEIYNATSQGEGMWLGTPCTFIRLAGCTVGCTFCDTKYSWKSTPRGDSQDLTPDLLVDKVLNINTHGHVIISGGEPLEHPHEQLALLGKRFAEEQYNITFETSGIYSPTGLGDEIVSATPNYMAKQLLWSVSPKLSSSGANYRLPNLEPFLDEAVRGCSVQFKFVVESREDVDEVAKYLEETAWHNAWNEPNPPWILFQPCSPVTNAAANKEINLMRDMILELTDYIQTVVDEHRALQVWSWRKVPVMVRPQIHTLIYGNKKGV